MPFHVGWHADGVLEFFSMFGKLHPRFGTPANAILLQMCGVLLVLCFGAFDRILAYIIFSAICFLSRFPQHEGALTNAPRPASYTTARG